MDAVNNSYLSISEFFEKYKERPKDVEQIRRILKQKIVANDEINIINTDSGHDPVTDRSIKIYTPKEATPYFYDELHDLEKQLMTRNFGAYTVVDSCLHIGLYKNKWKTLGRPLLEAIAKEFNLALWVPVQSTKDAINQEFVGLQHAGGSVKKTQIGHLIIQLAQTLQQKEEGRMSVFIGKLRAVKIGRTSFPNVKFNNGTCKFDMSDLDSIDNEPIGSNDGRVNSSFLKSATAIAKKIK
jgi:hypothetical protein